MSMRLCLFVRFTQNTRPIPSCSLTLIYVCFLKSSCISIYLYTPLPQHPVCAALYVLKYSSDPSLQGHSLFHVACNFFLLTLYEEKTLLLLEMIGESCGCLLLRVLTPHYPGLDFLSGLWVRGVSSMVMKGFHCIFTVSLCTVPYLHRLKSQLAHCCCTAAALHPQEELIVGSCSTATGEKPGVGKSVVCRPSVDRLVGVLPSMESRSHC